MAKKVAEVSLNKDWTAKVEDAFAKKSALDDAKAEFDLAVADVKEYGKSQVEGFASVNLMAKSCKAQVQVKRGRVTVADPNAVIAACNGKVGFLFDQKLTGKTNVVPSKLDALRKLIVAAGEDPDTYLTPDVTLSAKDGLYDGLADELLTKKQAAALAENVKIGSPIVAVSFKAV